MLIALSVMLAVFAALMIFRQVHSRRQKAVAEIVAERLHVSDLEKYVDSEYSGRYVDAILCEELKSSMLDVYNRVCDVERRSRILMSHNPSIAKFKDDFENLQNKFRSQPVGRCSDQLPCFINEDGFFHGTIFFGLIPDKIQCYKHTDGQQITGQFRDIQNGVFIVQIHIGLLVEGGGRAIYQSVHNVGKTSGIRIFLQDVVHISQNWHLSIVSEIFRVIQAAIVVSNSFFPVGLNQSLI